MPVKYLAITISGAVSLGSYEAGATYEILDAIRQHNQHPETIATGDFIRVDVLTGASAGGMTAAILAQKLLFAADQFVDESGNSSPYANPLYDTWVKTISLGLGTGGRSVDIAVNPDGRHAYVANSLTGSGSVSVIRTDVQTTLNVPAVSVSTNGYFAMMRWASVTKCSSNGLPLTLNSPLPGRRNTRATLDLRRPVP